MIAVLWSQRGNVAGFLVGLTLVGRGLAGVARLARLVPRDALPPPAPAGPHDAAYRSDRFIDLMAHTKAAGTKITTDSKTEDKK